MEERLYRGKRWLLPLLSLVGLVGLGAMSAPAAYSEYGATDSSTTASTTTIYHHKFTKKEYQSTFRTGAITSTPANFNLSGKIWAMSATCEQAAAVMDYESTYDSSEYHTETYGRGLKFGDSDHPVQTITMTLPSSELEGQAISSIMVNTSFKGSGRALVSCSVGGNLFGQNGDDGAGRLITNNDQEYTWSGTPTIGDVTLKWTQDTDTSKHALFIFYFSVAYIDSANNKAVQYADSFLSSTGEICLEDGATDTDALKSAWENMATAYKALASTDQSTVKNATSSQTDELGHMMQRYDYIYAKYGETLSLENFLDRAVVNYSAFIYPGDSGTALGLGIATVTLLAASGIALVGARALRKRKRG